MPRRLKKIKIRARLSIRERLRTIPPPAKWGAFVLVAGSLLAAGAYAARRHALESPALVLRLERVNVEGVPAWIDRASARELQVPPIEVFPAQIHLLDRAPLERIAAYYRGHEWVSSIDRLEYVFPGKSAPGGIECWLGLREPRCLVACEKTNEYFFADPCGRRLGGPLDEPPDPELRLPLLAWARDTPPERGEPWREERILAGLAIAAALEEEGLRYLGPHFVARIDLGNFGRRDRSEIQLITENRVGLQWGRSQRSEEAGRPEFADQAVKLDRLRAILSDRIAPPPGAQLNLFEPLEDQTGGRGWASARQP